MKKSIFFLASLLFLWSCQEKTAAPKEIPYGSNNGKYVNIYGTQIYYEEYGEGAPLLLLQGGGGGIADFALCIPELSKHYRCIAPDTPGQGRSGIGDSVSYELMAGYASKLIDELKLDSAYVIGWSDGGITGLILASQRPDKIKGVVASGANYLLSGYPSIEKDTTDMEKVFNDPQFEIDNKKDLDEYMSMTTPPRDWKKMAIGMWKLYHKEVYFSPQLLRDIKVPVMIVVGDHDGVTLEHAIDMHRMIEGSQFCVLPNTSHAVFKEKPELINEIALKFFRQ